MSRDELVTVTMTRLELDMLRKTSDNAGAKMRSKMDRRMYDAWRSAIAKCKDAAGGDEAST